MSCESECVCCRGGPFLSVIVPVPWLGRSVGPSAVPLLQAVGFGRWASDQSRPTEEQQEVEQQVSVCLSLSSRYIKTKENNCRLI